RRADRGRRPDRAGHGRRGAAAALPDRADIAAGAESAPAPAHRAIFADRATGAVRRSPAGRAAVDLLSMGRFGGAVRPLQKPYPRRSGRLRRPDRREREIRGRPNLPRTPPPPAVQLTTTADRKETPSANEE